MRIHSLFFRLALVVGVWAALAGLSDAQGKGKGKGKGGGSNAAARANSAKRAPVRTAPRNVSNARGPVKRDTVNRSGPPRDAASRNLAAGRSLNRTLGYPYGYGPYGYYGRGWDDNNDDWWRFAVYGAAARFLGASFGNFGYGAYPFYPYGGLGYGGGFGSPYYGGFGGYPYYGGYPYSGGLGGYGGYGYYPRFGLGLGLGGGTQPYYSGVPYASVAPMGAVPATGAVPAGDVATLDVIVPDPDARVWVQGRETSSRGAQRVYHSPPLERGYKYTYTVRATWRENGQTMTAQRSVPVRPGRRVNVDFTQGIAQPVAE